MTLEYDEVMAIVIGQIVGTITFTMFYDKLLKVVRVIQGFNIILIVAFCPKEIPKKNCHPHHTKRRTNG